jgi:hypothetical protein
MASTDLVLASDYASLTPDTIRMVSAALGTGQLREFDLKRVKMATGGVTKWIVPSLDDPDGESVKQIEGIILAHKLSRTYWEKPYTGAGEIPDCSSRDAKLAIPQRMESEDPDVEDDFFQPPAQLVNTMADGAPVYSCDSCALAQWGSKIRDGKATRGQACKLTHQLFLLAPATRLPLVVSLPPTSLKPAQNYLLDLLDYGIDVKRVTTVITLEKATGKGVPDYARAVFRKGDTLDDDQFELARQYSEMLAPAFQTIIAERDDVEGAAAEAAA